MDASARRYFLLNNKAVNSSNCRPKMSLSLLSSAPIGFAAPLPAVRPVAQPRPLTMSAADGMEGAARSARSADARLRPGQPGLAVELDVEAAGRAGLDGEVEHEVGRTETVMDDLSP